MATRSEIVKKYLQEAQGEMQNKSYGSAWRSLEIAHIVSQPSWYLHTWVHAVMLKLAWKTFNWQEIFGQIFRFLVATPGSLSGKYPLGNTGRSDVSAFVPMQIPDDVKALLRSISQ